MWALQQLKNVRLGQDPDVEKNLLSLAIQSDMISPTIRMPKERFSGHPIQPITQQLLKVIWISMALPMPPNAEHFQRPLEGWHNPGTTPFLLSLL